MNIGSEGGSNSQDFDLNLAPIIDCFTVLITFMLVSASFISIGILDAGAGIPGQASSNQTPPAETIQIELQPQFSIEIKLTGAQNQNIQLPAQSGKWDYDGLTRELTNTKQKWPKVDSLILSASNDIQYIQIIQCMEKIKKLYPGVLLGGF